MTTINSRTKRPAKTAPHPAKYDNHAVLMGAGELWYDGGILPPQVVGQIHAILLANLRGVEDPAASLNYSDFSWARSSKQKARWELHYRGPQMPIQAIVQIAEIV